MFKLRKPVYAVQDPTCPVPGLYVRLDGEHPRLKTLDKACLAPATPQGLEWLALKASALLGTVPHEIVRVEP